MGCAGGVVGSYAPEVSTPVNWDMNALTGDLTWGHADILDTAAGGPYTCEDLAKSSAGNWNEIITSDWLTDPNPPNGVDCVLGAVKQDGDNEYPIMISFSGSPYFRLISEDPFAWLGASIQCYVEQPEGTLTPCSGVLFGTTGVDDNSGFRPWLFTANQQIYTSVAGSYHGFAEVEACESFRVVIRLRAYNKGDATSVMKLCAPHLMIDY